MKCPQCHMVTTNKHLCWGDVPIVDDYISGIEKYWKQKRKSSKTRGIEFLLTPRQLIQLFEDAGITANDVGKGSQQYQLGRHNDTGCYEEGNCCFITTRENSQKPDFDRVKQKYTKAIVTPMGEFPSVRLGAKLIGITRQTLSNRLRDERVKWSQWHYAKT